MALRSEHEYIDALDGASDMLVRFVVEDRELVDYSVVLRHVAPGEQRYVAVRVFDFSHGIHDEHRCDRDGNRLQARRFHQGSVQEGFEEARRLIRSRYETIIEEWLR